MIRRAVDLSVGDVVQIEGMTHTLTVVDPVDLMDGTLVHLCTEEPATRSQYDPERARIYPCFDFAADEPVTVVESAIPDLANVADVESFLNT